MFLELLLIFVLCTIGYCLMANRLRGLPPGPIPLPLVGNMMSFSNELAKDLLNLSKKYGPVFTIWMPGPVVVIADSKIIHDSIVRGGDTYGDRPPSSRLKILFDPYGATWKEQRRFAFQTFKEVGFLSAKFRGMITNYALEVVENWKETASRGDLVDVTDNLQSAVSNVIWQLTFGRTLPLRDAFFKELSDVTHKQTRSIVHPFIVLTKSFPFLEHIDFLIGSPIKRAEDLLEEVFEITREELRKVEWTLNEDEPPRCYADAFLMEISRREKEGITDGNFNRHQLLVSATSHWIAGIETTVTTLRFAVYFLIRYPAVQQKMQEEIDEKIGQREICMEDQKLLPYCMATLLEIQRLANVGQLNFLRLSSKETVIGGHKIPAGTSICPQFPSTFLDSDLFENAEELNPERFINENGEFVKDPKVTPFSIGVRACPGEGLAKMELFLFITTFGQHLSFSRPESSPEEIKIIYGLSKSLVPFNVKITARN